MPTRLAHDNPFASPSTLPFALPPFAEIRDEHYPPAFEAAFAEQLDEIERIATDPDPATFENTIEALERSGRLLRRVAAAFYNVASAHATPVIEAIETEINPRYAAHDDAITLDDRLYARIRTVADHADELDLTPEQAYVLRRTETAFRVGGAALDEAGKAALRELNQRLSTLTTTFQQRLSADANDLALVLDDESDLAGLSSSEIRAAARAAADRGLDGSYVLPLSLFTNQPALARLERRDVRERLFRASIARGARGNANDTGEVVLEIVRLRARRAELLGFPNESALVAARSTAGSPEVIAERLALLAPPAARNARVEQEVLQGLADALQREAGGEPFALEPWDWSYYAELVRARDHEIDTAALRDWFEAERVLRDGVFEAATRLYGVRFVERDDLVGYHPDVRVFEVDDEDGTPVGLYLLDLFTRDEKRGGAWMNDLVQQNRLFGDPTVVTNNLNVPRPSEGAPALLTLDEVETLFHEFGHALHGLFAIVDYPSSGGTNVERDFVEFPSQVNESWMLEPEIVENYARHVETGEPLPTDLIDRLVASSAFNEGFATSEYLAASVLDQAWHTLSAADAQAIDDVDAFEAVALERAGLDNPLVPPRYSSRTFQHIFAGGYAAGYYGYIWSEVLDADTVEWFRENGGLRRENGDRFRSRLLGVGGSLDPMAAYRDFRGRDARLEPLLERRGLMPVELDAPDAPDAPLAPLDEGTAHR
ncbi:M3 family metallopeptidase [Pseudoclavibacter chungangensis]|uniref:M3 family metallopeptidase n=1 Tax=Pseudoclavibacter chungangensis TaxID=587635 RepID=A0A7J5BRC5_9MICO|nr:M3 family metallopeptidase [Pseudoclavibacter chungangensis]KAB1656820.1 M3 family metallopeptidase [Pseudoclavibacter chungangensis]NYJ67271.1 peptidyl-dipeptidase Dcp [Pseudoclavibacter chungangensis]